MSFVTVTLCFVGRGVLMFRCDDSSANTVCCEDNAFGEDVARRLTYLKPARDSATQWWLGC